MLNNYFKTAWRFLIKDKQFSLLNILGLSTGLACVLLIYLWVSDELNIDKFNANDNRLYQVLKRNPDGAGNLRVSEKTQGLLAEALAKELPEVESAACARIERDPGILSVHDKEIKARPEFASREFLQIFSYPLIKGNKDNVLSDPTGILLSDAIVLKLFNTTDVVGKTVEFNFKHPDADFTGSYTITGVFKSPPANSTDPFDVLLPFDLYAQKKVRGPGNITNWGSNMASTYLLLKPNTDLKTFDNKIRNFTKAKVRDLGREALAYEGDLFIQKYSDRYLHNNYTNGIQSGGRIEYVKLFSVIAIFILVIACINFMNLSTAKASKRMKEAGIKKVVGASRASLIAQYMVESLLMSLISLCFAGVIVFLLLPAFRQITGKDIGLHFNSGIITAATGIALLTGIVAGSYPAFYLSRFKPVEILKGKLKTAVGESWIRKGLVVFQFTISVILIISVLTVYRQMKLIHTTNLGYNKSSVIRFANDGSLPQHLPSLMVALKNIPEVINASGVSGDLMGSYDHSGGGIGWEGKDPNLKIEYYGNAADAGFIETMNLQMAEGRSFSKSFADSSSVIFNQAAIAAMGLKNPVGKTVSLWGKQKLIIGVLKDYHYQSFYNKIGPAFFTFSENNPTTVVKIKAGSIQPAIAAIKELYKKYNSGLDFTYSFLDDDYNRLYASEQRVAVLSGYFAGIAIVISCLGVFGLAAFTAQKRQKEIGIRKVIGASAANMVAMLSKDFLKLVIISLLVATPLAWWFMNHWLQGFAYRITIGWWVFALAGIISLFIALITVSFQAIRAAMANPVISLRSE
jgi:putative ABC transport system permease protein